MDDIPEVADCGGAAAAERPLSTISTSTSPADPSLSEIGRERLEKAEAAAHTIVSKVQPTTLSEERRKDVIDYVLRLIKNRLGAEVFPYGSVPLKTYLPDGDIDLTAFGGVNVEDNLVEDMKAVLEEEENNRFAEFDVKDVQLISAEVKLVKCIVQNIVVDISFNQLGGLSTLCFLEQVDRLIGKDHLFKRSIILIKAWCYYESRILGAHHGLISTYALETLVLYIFHLFHTTLDGPMTVLYKFLDYFSKFDWETYCISLNGPVRISSLPEIVAETPKDGSGDLLLTDDFLRSCVEEFAIPLKQVDQYRGFQTKHLNIVDPLKEINNLGRSISKGNFYRIRSAFSYGAKKLGAILMLPEDRISNELQIFFSSTMQRHGARQKAIVQDPYPQSTSNSANADELDNPSIEGLSISSSLADLHGDYETHFNYLQQGRFYCGYTSGVSSFLLPNASNNPWDGYVYPSPYGPNGFSQAHPSDFIPIYAIPHVLVPATAFGRDEMHKQRGTGTYFPKLDQSPQGSKPSAFRGKNNVISVETNFVDKNGYEQSPSPQYLIDQTIHLGSPVSYSPRGSGPTPSGTSFSDRNRQQRTPSSNPQIQSPNSPGMQRPRDRNRGSFKSSYHLKDQEDFPPLSV